jgi:hypothetical protein
VPGENFDLVRFRDYLVGHLVEYGPLFSRILATIDLTGPVNGSSRIFRVNRAILAPLQIQSTSTAPRGRRS